MNRNIMRVAKEDSTMFNQLSGVEEADVIAYTGRYLGRDSFPEYVEQLDTSFRRLQSPRLRQPERRLIEASLIAAPHLRNKTYTELLAATAYASTVADTATDGSLWNMSYCPDLGAKKSFYRLPLNATLDRAWKFDSTTAFHTQEYDEIRPYADYFRWNMLQVARIAHYGGSTALKSLKDDFGIRNPGRYPLDQLLKQVADPESEVVREVPIYSAADDSDAVLWEDQSVEALIDFVDRSPIVAQPVIYEVRSLTQLMSRMAHAKNPLFGAVNSHGIGRRIWLTNSGETTIADIRTVNARTRREVQERWANAAGLLVLSCEAAGINNRDAHGVSVNDSIANAFSDTVGCKVVASRFEATGIKINRRKRGASHVVNIAIQSPNGKSGARLITPSQGLNLGADSPIELRAA
jgi:hypothetical protein